MTLVGDTIIHKLFHVGGDVEWSTHPEVMVEVDRDGCIVTAVLYDDALDFSGKRAGFRLLGWVAGYGSVDQRTMIDLQF